MPRRHQIFVMKRRSGVEHNISVWNLGGYIQTPIKRDMGWFRRELSRLAIQG